MTPPKSTLRGCPWHKSEDLRSVTRCPPTAGAWVLQTPTDRPDPSDRPLGVRRHRSSPKAPPGAGGANAACRLRAKSSVAVMYYGLTLAPVGSFGPASGTGTTSTGPSELTRKFCGWYWPPSYGGIGRTAAVRPIRLIDYDSQRRATWLWAAIAILARVAEIASAWQRLASRRARSPS